MGARGPHVDVEELLPSPVDEFGSVTWLDQQVLLDEFHREAQREQCRWELLGLDPSGGWRGPSGLVSRRALLHDEEWDRGGCRG